MRLNRNTLILIGVLALVILGALVLNNQQASAPGEATPTPAPVTGGPLFAAIETRTGDIQRIQVRDNVTGATVAYDKADSALWELASDPSVRLDQQPVIEGIEDFAGLDANDTFESDTPSQFGLETPAYSIFVTADDVVYVLHVGGLNFNSARYYVTTAEATLADLPPVPTAEATPDAESTPDAEATAEAEITPEATLELAEPLVTLTGTQSVSTLPRAVVDSFVALLTPTLASDPTPEPTLVLESLMSTPEATAEATPEATEAAPAEMESTAEAEATAEATPEATETP